MILLKIYVIGFIITFIFSIFFVTSDAELKREFKSPIFDSLLISLAWFIFILIWISELFREERL